MLGLNALLADQCLQDVVGPANAWEKNDIIVAMQTALCLYAVVPVRESANKLPEAARNAEALDSLLEATMGFFLQPLSNMQIRIIPTEIVRNPLHT